MADIDMETAISSQDLGLGEPIEEEVVEPPEEPIVEAEATDAPVVADPAVVEPVVRAPPRTWSKETHEIWNKLTPEAQAQIERREEQIHKGIEQYREHSGLGKELNEVLHPYMPIITAQGLTPAKAVHSLLNAHYRLTQGPVEQRQAAYQQLGVSMGLVKPEGQAPMDPALQELQRQVQSLTSSLTEKQQRDFKEAETRVSAQVTEFAAASPYFDEVAEDMMPFLHAGMELNAAYDKAIWANPVTRAKETARLQNEAEKNLREKSKQEAEAAKKATSANVRNRDTKRAPTDPLGKMEDTMKSTLAEIKSRAH